MCEYVSIKKISFMHSFIYSLSTCQHPLWELLGWSFRMGFSVTFPHQSSDAHSHRPLTPAWNVSPLEPGSMAPPGVQSFWVSLRKEGAPPGGWVYYPP